MFIGNFYRAGCKSWGARLPIFLTISPMSGCHGQKFVTMVEIPILRFSTSKSENFVNDYGQTLTFPLSKMVNRNLYLEISPKMFTIMMSMGYGGNFGVLFAVVRFLTIDHGTNSRVSWSWSVPDPPPPTPHHLNLASCNITVELISIINSF